MSTIVATKTPRTKVPDFVPNNYEELFHHYYALVIGLVVRSGIDFQNREDVAMTIISKFFEKGVLEDFDPDFTSSHGGVVRKAVFRTFLSGFVKSYVPYYRNRQQINKFREPVMADTVIDFGQHPDAPFLLRWIDFCGPVMEETYDELYYGDLINKITAHLATLNPEKTCSLRDLFVQVVAQVEASGSPNTDLLAAHFGVSATTVRTRMLRLKDAIHEALAT